MTNPDQELWSRVKERLRAIVGDNVFSSWFGGMELDSIGDGDREAVGADALSQELDAIALRRETPGLLAGRAPAIMRIELTVRSAVPRACRPRSSLPRPSAAAHDLRDTRSAGDMRGADAGLGHARFARRLAARSAADLRELRGRPLQHAGARRRQTGGARPARRSGDVQSALHPCRRRPRQDAPAAGACLGRQCRRPSARCST